MGGEITWECTPSGNFRFVMKLYRECYYGNGAAANYGNTANLTTTVPGFSMINMTRVSGYPIDISPVCNSDTNFLHTFCSDTFAIVYLQEQWNYFLIDPLVSPAM